jgi:integrase
MIHIRSVLNYAIKRRKLDDNIASYVDLPKVEDYKPIILTIEEAKMLLNHTPSRERAIIACSMLAGIDTGTIFGLEPKHINFNLKPHATINLCQQYTDGKIVKHLKTKYREGTIPICDLLRDILYEWLTTSGYLFKQYVFQGKKEGKPLHPSTWVSKTFRKLLEKNGLHRMRLYDCRHTFVSIALYAGISTFDTSKLARHASERTTTDIYGHLLPGQIDNALKIIDGIFGENAVENSDAK